MTLERAKKNRSREITRKQNGREQEVSWIFRDLNVKKMITDAKNETQSCHAFAIQHSCGALVFHVFAFSPLQNKTKQNRYSSCFRHSCFRAFSASSDRNQEPYYSKTLCEEHSSKVSLCLAEWFHLKCHLKKQIERQLLI